jgi:Family of unknown function (DUF6085)
MRDLSDLIAQVLAKHRTEATGSVGGNGPHWSCRCGERHYNRPILRDAIEAADRHTAGQIVAAVEASQPDHLIEFSDAGWTIQHSMACRLGGQLFACPINQAADRLAVANWPDDSGRYRCTLGDDGRLVIGEAVS